MAWDSRNSIQGEKLSGNVTAANEFCVEFQEFIKSEELLQDHIYNVDELVSTGNTYLPKLRHSKMNDMPWDINLVKKG
jgi:hypothetical protein